jgi:Mn2+/Fe2+ NRAMP family transporter
MGDFTAPRWMTVAASVVALAIISLNLKFIIDFASG